MKTPKLGRVYKIICDVPVDKVVYVGKTTQSLQGRLVHHWTSQKSPTALNRFINQTGREHFRIEAIFESYDSKELAESEEYWILKFDCLNQGLNKRLGTKPTAQERQVQRDTNYRNRPVICDTDGSCYNSCAHAARHYGLNASDVSECCALRLRQVKGYRFRYADVDRVSYTTYWMSGIYRNRRVGCVETADCWGSVYQASKALGISRSAVVRALTKGTPIKPSGFHLQYLDKF